MAMANAAVAAVAVIDKYQMLSTVRTWSYLLEILITKTTDPIRNMDICVANKYRTEKMNTSQLVTVIAEKGREFMAKSRSLTRWLAAIHLNYSKMRKAN